MWTDSNGKGLNPEKFWKTDGSLYETTYTIQDVNRKLDANRNTSIECIVVNCGVNDIEEQSGQEVATEIISTIHRIRHEHPTTKIIWSEITPFHRRDKEVIECNKKLHEEQWDNNTIIATMDHLRDDSWSKFAEDRKHVKGTCVPVFAGSLIAAIRRVYKMPQKYERREPNRSHQNHSGENNGQYSRVPYDYTQSNTQQKPVNPLMSHILPNPYGDARNNPGAPIQSRLTDMAYGTANSNNNNNNNNNNNSNNNNNNNNNDNNNRKQT